MSAPLQPDAVTDKSRARSARRMRRVILTILTACLSSAACVLTAHAAIPATERQVLINLFTSFDASADLDSLGWNGPPGTECTWYGVTCDETGSHVTAINLSNGLGGPAFTGTLPQSLSALPALLYFQVYGNRLTGQLPDLTGLTSLTFFVVGSNQFSGPLPSLRGLRSLTYLDAANNALTGSIPSLSDLTSLDTLKLNNNQLTGSIPSLDALTSLTDLRLDNNQLTGSIPGLDALGSLTSLEVRNNSLSGAIPPLHGLSSLIVFSAANNTLTGPIPDFTDVATLESFDVHGNRLTGPIPPLNELRTLDVSGNRLTGSIPSLDELVSLSASDNQLSGTIPPLAGARNLQYFTANNNQLSGSIPVLPSTLISFSATRNQLTGGLPSLPPALVAFNAHTNQLSGALPNLSGLRRLSIFSVSNNSLTGSLPSLDDLQSLAFFYVNNNKLTGTIPPLPHNSSGRGSLVSLDVTGNRFTGSLPALDGQDRLVLLYADNNQLTGPIPSLEGLQALAYAFLNDNQLTGTIPNLSGLTSLQLLYANNNRLSGQIPSLSGLSTLRYFSVQNNGLTGSIPDLRGLTELRSFYVYNNLLTGAIPETVPALLAPGDSRLCPNRLDHIESAGWDVATGVTPWWRDCVSDGSIVVSGSLEPESLQTLRATELSSRYEWDVDGAGTVGRVGTSDTLEVKYPSEFDGNVSVRYPSGGGTAVATRPLKTEAPRMSVVAGSPVEVCDGDGVPQPGKRFNVPVTITNGGSVGLRDGYAVFASAETVGAAGSGRALVGGLNVDTPLVSVGLLGANTSKPGVTDAAPLSVTVSLSADAQCGSSYGLRFMGGFDGVSFSKGQPEPVATLTIPSGSQCKRFVGSCSPIAGASAAKSLFVPRQGLYLNNNRPGNGLSSFLIPGPNATQVYFGAWFTGEPDRSPTWYIIQGTMSGNTVVAPIYKYTRDVGSSGFSVHGTVVGDAVIVMKGSEQLALSYRIGDRSGIELMDYLVGGPAPAQNRTGAYYNPTESGWGLVIHQYLVNGQSYTFGVDYIYDAAGQPRWVLTQAPTAQLAASSNSVFTFRVHCPGCAWLRDWNAYPVDTGTGGLSFTDATHASLTSAIVLPAPYAGTWTRDHLPMVLLTTPQ